MAGKSRNLEIWIEHTGQKICESSHPDIRQSDLGTKLGIRDAELRNPKSATSSVIHADTNTKVDINISTAS